MHRNPLCYHKVVRCLNCNSVFKRIELGRKIAYKKCPNCNARKLIFSNNPKDRSIVKNG